MFATRLYVDVVQINHLSGLTKVQHMPLVFTFIHDLETNLSCH